MPFGHSQRCTIKGCDSGFRTCREKLSMFRIPNNPFERDKWIEHLPESSLPESSLIESGKRIIVCEKHFDTSDIIRSLEINDISLPNRRVRLKKGAYPKYFPGFAQPEEADGAETWEANAACNKFLPTTYNNILEHVLCSKHFDDSYFEPDSNKTVFKADLDPIPTLFEHNIKEEIGAQHNEDSTSNEMPDENVDLKIPAITELILPTLKHEEYHNAIEPKLMFVKSDRDLAESEHEFSESDIDESDHEFADSDHDFAESDHDSAESHHDSAELDHELVETDPLQIDTVVGQQTLPDVDDFVENDEFGNLKYTDNIYEEFVRNPSVLNVRSDAGDRVTRKTYCRLCARVVAVASLISIFTDAECVKYKELLEYCIPGLVTEDDELPHNMCRPCLTKLEYCSVTLKEFKKADNKLKTLLNFPITIDEPNEIKTTNPKDAPDIVDLVTKRPLPPLPPLIDCYRTENPRKSLQTKVIEPNPLVLINTPPESSPIFLKKASAPAESNDTKYECLMCSSLFDVKNDLIEHSLKEHPTPNRNQIVCKVVRTKRGESSMEETPEQKLLKFECVKCLKMFLTRNEMINHALQDHATPDKRNKIVCRVIKTVDSPSKVEITEKVLDPKKPNIKYECLICGSLHDKKHTLVRHTIDFHQSLSGNKILCRVVRTGDSRRRVVKCLRCNTKFTDLKSYRKHMRSHITFKCEHCGMKFNRIFNLKHHRKVHRKQIVSKCDECSIQFKTKTELRKHLKSVHTKRRNEENGKIAKSDVSRLCNICGKLFPNKNYLKRHVKLHGAERLHCCKLCSKSFKLKSSLTRHIETHTRVFNYICQTCGKQFRTIVGLKQHMLIHSGNRPHMCDTCGEQYLRRTDLAKHKLKHDKPNLKRQVTCRICQKVYPTRTSLQYHMTQHGEKMYKCEECNKQLGSRVQYVVHMRVHTGELPYSCEVCNKSFRSKPLVKQHKIIHQSSYKYRCEVCDKDFKTLRSLKVHKNIHNQGEKYKCSVCHREFMHKGEKLKHERIHEKHQPVLKDGSYYFLNDSEEVVEETVVDSMTDLEIATQSILNLSKDLPIIHSVVKLTANSRINNPGETDAKGVKSSILKRLLE